MMTRWFPALLLPIVLLSGCIKTEYDPDQSEGKITEILDEGKKTIGIYYYDQSGLVIESWFGDNSYTQGEKAEYTYSYNSEKQLIHKTGYEPGIIFMSSFTGALGKKVDYNYEYDSKGRVEKVKVDYHYESEMVLDFSRVTSYQYPSSEKTVETPVINDPAVNYVPVFTEYRFN
jgi:hypothetical protein